MRSNRKWTVTVSVAGQDVTDMLDLGDPRTAGSCNDTLKDTTDAAIALVTYLIREYEMGSDGSIQILKQLKTDAEPRYDRGLYVYRDWDRNGDAVIRVQR